MILSVAVFKIFHVLPRSVEQSCTVWFRFVAKYMTAPLLVGIGVTYTDLSLVIDTFSIVNTLQVIAVVLGAVLGAGLGGVLVASISSNPHFRRSVHGQYGRHRRRGRAFGVTAHGADALCPDFLPPGRRDHPGAGGPGGAAAHAVKARIPRHCFAVPALRPPAALFLPAVKLRNRVQAPGPDARIQGRTLHAEDAQGPGLAVHAASGKTQHMADVAALQFFQARQIFPFQTGKRPGRSCLSAGSGGGSVGRNRCRGRRSGG